MSSAWSLEGGRAVGIALHAGRAAPAARGPRARSSSRPAPSRSPHVLERPASATASACAASGSRSCTTRRASARTCRTTCSSGRSIKVKGVRTLNTDYAKLWQRGLMALEYAFLRTRPAHHGALAARCLRAIVARLRDRQPGIPLPAALARQVGRGPAPVRRLHGERLQPAPVEPRQRPPRRARARTSRRRSGRTTSRPTRIAASPSMPSASTRRIVAQAPLRALPAGGIQARRAARLR